VHKSVERFAFQPVLLLLLSVPLAGLVQP